MAGNRRIQTGRALAGMLAVFAELEQECHRAL
jgi:hypothetical protein